MDQIVSFEDWLCSINFNDEKKLLLVKKLVEFHLKPLDIAIFINAVQHKIPCKDIANGFGISINSVRRRLAKVRRRFPSLRIYNRNRPFKKPRLFSRTEGERLFNGRIYHGPNREVNSIQEFDDNTNTKIIRKF